MPPKSRRPGERVSAVSEPPRVPLADCAYAILALPAKTRHQRSARLTCGCRLVRVDVGVGKSSRRFGRSS